MSDELSSACTRPTATITHLIPHLRFGAGRYVTDLAVAQSRRGATVRVGLSDDLEESTWQSDPSFLAELAAADVTWGILGDFFHRDLELLKTASARLRAVKWLDSPGVLHSHTAVGTAVGRWAGGRTVVTTCHGWDVGRPAAFDVQDAFAFSLADRVMSPSRAWAARVSSLTAGLDVAVLPLGVDLARYPAAATPHTGQPRIVCVGELCRRKGQDLLLAAMPTVWQRHPLAQVALLGRGEEESRLRELAAAVDPGRSLVSFAGHVPRPFEELGRADVMCLPSRSDNQPVSIIESALSGCPVVAADVGGIAELLELVGQGSCVPPGDVEAIGQAISAILDERDGWRSARVPAAERARAVFGIDAHADRIEQLYRSALRRDGCEA
jgi:glycosyltransferase involved in cell wall biosynthesis